MKKLIYSSTLIFVLGTTTNAVLATEKKPKTELTADQKIQLDKIVKRVEEIRSMDKSTLSKDERKALRKELKEMKKRAKETRGGIYISVGAVIVIVLLLILLL